jgi:hypothetical protein
MGTRTEQTQPAQRERSEQAAIREIAQRLMKQFPDVPPEHIEHAIQGRYGRFEGSRIRDFVPVLVERSVRTELAAP